MGIMSTIFGGGGSKGYTPRNPYALDKQTRTSIFTRMGATPGYDKKGNIDNKKWDVSNTNKAVTAADANKNYDYSGVDEAIAGFKNPTQYSSTYNPTTFNFADNDMIDQQSDLQYGLGAKNINRQGSGALEKLRETTGTRRPGLLMKAGAQNQRDVGEQLAGLNTNLRTSALGQKLALGKDQQIAQAGENLNASNFNLGKESAQSDENYRNSGALADTSLNKVQTQESNRAQLQAENDRILEMLYNYWGKNADLKNGAAAQSQQSSGGVLGKVGGIAKGVGSIAKFI